jgi:hypothetical protein
MYSIRCMSKSMILDKLCPDLFNISGYRTCLIQRRIKPHHVAFQVAFGFSKAKSQAFGWLLKSKATKSHSKARLLPTLLEDKSHSKARLLPTLLEDLVATVRFRDVRCCVIGKLERGASRLNCPRIFSVLIHGNRQLHGRLTLYLLATRWAEGSARSKDASLAKNLVTQGAHLCTMVRQE